MFSNTGALFLAVSLPLLVAQLCMPASFNTSIRCPTDNESALPTPSYGCAGALFTICTERTINASLSVIYDAIIDFRRYPAWNSFVVSVALPENVTSPDDATVGMQMTFTTQGILPGINTTSGEAITVLDASLTGEGGSAAAVSAWRFNDGVGGLSGIAAEHPNVLTNLGNGTVRYVSWETYYGAVSVALLAMRDGLRNGFERQGDDLRAFVESGLTRV
jgi:hypothetical protein